VNATASLGIGDITPAQLQGNDFSTYQSYANALTGGANTFKYARMIVPWDTVDTGGQTLGSGCWAQNPAPSYGGTSYLSQVESFVSAARSKGLDPIIALGYDNGAGPGPANPSLNQYECGYANVVATLRTYAQQQGIAAPTEYEVYNEPSVAGVGTSCNPQAGSIPSGYPLPQGGAQCAAWYYYGAKTMENAFLGNSDTLVAGAFSTFDVNNGNMVFVNAYFNYLLGTIRMGPSVVSWHPYEDIAASGEYQTTESTDSIVVDNAIYSDYAGSGFAEPQAWITEASSDLNDYVTTYNGTSSGCSGESDISGKNGGCLDTNPRNQAYAAQAILQLPGIVSGIGVPVTRIYWWEWGGAAGQTTNADYGIFAPSGSPGNPDPNNAPPREAFCVLIGLSVSQAIGNSSCNPAANATDSQDYNGL
jgi:hypothetical protein